MPSRVLAVLSSCASVRPRLPAGTVYIYIYIQRVELGADATAAVFAGVGGRSLSLSLIEDTYSEAFECYT